MNEMPQNQRTPLRCCLTGAERLTRYLNSLPSESWKSPSACEKWAVRDVVGHLAWGASLYISAISLGVKGDTSPPEGFPSEGELNRESFPAWAAEQAVTFRKRQGERLLDTFIKNNTKLYKLMAGLRPHEWDTPCYHPLRLLEANVLLVFRAIELSLHAWDIQSVMDPLVPLLPESLPILMEQIPETLLNTFVPNNRLESPICFRFLVTGRIPGELDLVIEGDRVRVESIGETKAHVTCRSDTETFALLMFHRLSPQTAMDSGRLSVEGDEEIILTFDKWFKFA